MQSGICTIERKSIPRVDGLWSKDVFLSSRIRPRNDPRMIDHVGSDAGEIKM